MHHPLLKICLLGILWQAEGTIIAQDNIILNDSFALHADTLMINVDYPVTTDLKFNLGDYTITADLEMRNASIDTKKRLLGLREVTDITHDLSFSISDSSSQSATVSVEVKNRDNAYRLDKAINFYSNTFHSNNDQEDYSVVDDEDDFYVDHITTGKLESLIAPITIPGDSTATWTLFILKAKGNQWRPPVEMFLTDGMRKINLYHVSSDPYYDYSHPLRQINNMPAMGVEFLEEGKSLCAIQYDSGPANNFDLGPIQSFGCKAWMLPDLDPKTKLILAATMSTLMMMNNQYLNVFEQ